MTARSSIDLFEPSDAVAVDGIPLQPAAAEPVQVPRASLVGSLAEGLVITALLAELAVVLANVLARAFFVVLPEYCH
jgi:hypothetical protein